MADNDKTVTSEADASDSAAKPAASAKSAAPAEPIKTVSDAAADEFLDEHAIPHGRHRDYMAARLEAIADAPGVDAFVAEFANSDEKAETMRAQLAALTGIKAE